MHESGLIKRQMVSSENGIGDLRTRFVEMVTREERGRPDIERPLRKNCFRLLRLRECSRHLTCLLYGKRYGDGKEREGDESESICGRPPGRIDVFVGCREKRIVERSPPLIIKSADARETRGPSLTFGLLTPRDSMTWKVVFSFIK